MTRDERRKRMMARDCTGYAQIATAGHHAQMMDRCRMRGLISDGIPLNRAGGFELLVGSLTRPSSCQQALPATTGKANAGAAEALNINHQARNSRAFLFPLYNEGSLTGENWMSLQQLKIDLGETEAQAKAIREQIAEAEKKERADAMAPVLTAIKTHSFTAQELGLTTAPKVKAEKTKTSGAKVEPKYRDPASGAEWTGRGKTPAWMARQIDGAGRRKDDFLIPPAPPASESILPAAQDPGQPTVQHKGV